MLIAESSIAAAQEYSAPSGNEYYVNAQTPAPIVDGVPIAVDGVPSVAKDAEAEKRKLLLRRRKKKN